MPDLRAPFPWFGGKSRVARQVWERFGNVANYVEPFAGSLAVLLGRPTPPGLETVNDRDAYLVNFWRTVAAAPDEVARWADWPISEIDLHARHAWLLRQTGMVERLRADPDFFDAKMAGWWVWGLSSWIGSGWCSALARQLPNVSGGGRGVHSAAVNGLADGVSIREFMRRLSARLRRARICCGDWERVCSPAVTSGNGLTGVFLDPPYGSDEHDIAYAGDAVGDVSFSVERWAIENGDNPLLRIALCGYEGEHAMPASWACFEWKAVGGFGLQGDERGRANRGRERIWFSPHCLKPLSLFGDIEEEAECVL